ncbi:MAG: DsbA family protein [Alphaproteobacteria bacterium]|nr:DsbA family protein [Alphaproteobacteria bacterium]
MIRTLYAFLLVLALTTTPLHTIQAQDFTDAQKAEIKKLFDEYLANSGQQILESVNNYQAELAEKDRQEQSKKAKAFIKSLNGRENLPSTGNDKADVTIVEFFDYNCGYCRKALEEIRVVLKKDDKVKVIFIDMPILGPASVEAAKWSIAAHRMGKYFEFHQAVMDHNGPKDEKNLERLAKDVGLNVKKMKKEKDKEDIQKIIDQNLKEARDIGINGTPGFIIGEEVYPGFVQAAQIQEVITETRKAK